MWKEGGGPTNYAGELCLIVRRLWDSPVTNTDKSLST